MARLYQMDGVQLPPHLVEKDGPNAEALAHEWRDMMREVNICACAMGSAFYYGACNPDGTPGVGVMAATVIYGPSHALGPALIITGGVIHDDPVDREVGQQCLVSCVEDAMRERSRWLDPNYKARPAREYTAEVVGPRLMEFAKRNKMGAIVAGGFGSAINDDGNEYPVQLCYAFGLRLVTDPLLRLVKGVASGATREPKNDGLEDEFRGEIQEGFNYAVSISRPMQQTFGNLLKDKYPDKFR